MIKKKEKQMKDINKKSKWVKTWSEIDFGIAEKWNTLNV